MNKIVYKKDRKIKRKIVRFAGLLLAITGFLSMLYLFFPLLSWELYFKSAQASSGITTPIPYTKVLTKNIIQGLLQASAQSLQGIDYTNASNWFPTYQEKKINKKISSYTITIPKINIANAYVSTTDYDLSKHLVHFGGTALPPEKGNAVIFGHSTLPQLYNPKDYKTIFANIHSLKVGDTMHVNVDGISYVYRIFRIRVVKPDDTSVLAQNYDDSYLTIITCTPPGTIWMRLIIEARLETL
ncbi:MAG: sortase [Candidatus Levybacteria bacterium]|nr:sortase [Candidatus Levybacteria bacterium]